MNYQTLSPVESVFALPVCDITLAIANEDDSIGDNVWTAKSVENVRCSDRMNKVVTRPTGSRYRSVRHQHISHEISIDAKWNIAGAMQRNADYALTITMNEAWIQTTGVQQIHYRRYYGVKHVTRDLTGTNEFTETHVLRATRLQEVTSLVDASGQPLTDENGNILTDENGNPLYP